MGVFKTTNQILILTKDILEGLNATVWGGVEKAEKVGKIVTTGLTGADVVIGTSHTLEDLACQDYFCSTMDIIATVSTAVGAYLGNSPDVKKRKLTWITGSITTGARSIRWYCKNYGTFWGCTVALSSGAKKVCNLL